MSERFYYTESCSGFDIFDRKQADPSGERAHRCIKRASTRGWALAVCNASNKARQFVRPEEQDAAKLAIAAWEKEHSC